MEIIQAHLTKNPYWAKNKTPTDPRYREYQQHGPKGLVLHSIGCPQPSAMVLIKSWNDPNYTRACIHGFIDANTGTVYQTMPFNYRAPHAGGDATDTHIGIEMCEPDCIRYTSGSNFTCSNVPRAREMVRRTYLAAVELFAQTCAEYGWDPMEDGVIISHREGHERGIASNHGDPEHLWKGLGLDYTMDTFRKDVKNKMIELNKVEALRPGDNGEAVRQLQGILRLAGYYEGELDGSYGLQTTEAVTKFQEANGLEADGKAGPKTLEALRGFDFKVKFKEGQGMSEKRYQRIDEMPEWARATIAKLESRGWLKGDDHGNLDLSEDMIRQLVINDRAGLYD